MPERDMNVLPSPPSSCSPNEVSSANVCMSADPGLLGLHLQVHVHENPSMHLLEDEIHVDTFLHIHDEATFMDTSTFEDKCIHEDMGFHEDKYRQHVRRRIDDYRRSMHMNADVIDHLPDCSPPPTLLDSCDTSLASPRGSLDPHPYPSDLIAFFQGSDPAKEEIDRLQNEGKEKNRELHEARAEIKALKITERSREKALEELSDELAKVDERLARAELLLENKNLELKRAIEDKKAAQGAQLAAEAVMRRIQSANSRDEELPPIEAILAPLDAELRLTRQEVARLHEDNRALDRLTKSKEAALLEAERMVQIATSKASLVDDLQNKNQELMKHIDCCQEENKVLDKLHRQKITEVEKLSIRVAEMEELLLSSGPNEANAARDYQRRLHQLQEEKKALERELARVKITANRVAAVVANGWKGSNDKVMPVKHWLEERRLLQSEMEQLREKLVAMERAAKGEAILKGKLHLRLKVLEESLILNTPPSTNPSHVQKPNRNIAAAIVRHASLGGVGNSINLSSSTSICNRSNALIGRTLKEHMQDQQVGGRKMVGRCNSARELLLQKSMVSLSMSFNEPNPCDVSSMKPDMDSANRARVADSTLPPRHAYLEEEMANRDCGPAEFDRVSGQLYDLLQKEVIILRKACQQKDCSLSEKESAIEMLEKKVCSLTRSMEVESKKLRREVIILEKEVATLRVSASTPRTPVSSKHKKSVLHPQPPK
ncbi:hypothetical protein GOP47_0001368 [Adiantum capillus-veneris]|uniref:Uncharacterized protein n=1 Tax=Adiantum capillus-veneris TaxID=13818 RepID=A0A9D4ZQN3_ADICA|nr:hypothetical protein GOP47_0001368 [Adiantum capillus-veneris]